MLHGFAALHDGFPLHGLVALLGGAPQIPKMSDLDVTTFADGCNPMAGMAPHCFVQDEVRQSTNYESRFASRPIMAHVFSLSAQPGSPTIAKDNVELVHTINTSQPLTNE